MINKRDKQHYTKNGPGKKEIFKSKKGNENIKK